MKEEIPPQTDSQAADSEEAASSSDVAPEARAEPDSPDEVATQTESEQGLPEQEAVEGQQTNESAGSREEETSARREQQTMPTQEISFSRSTADLLRFIRFSDFVACDYNQDGKADILAFNQRLSTGYGFTGMGNGLFIEGPSFDLPFRPAAAESLTAFDEIGRGLFLVSSVGTVSIFYPLVDDDPSMSADTSSFVVFRVASADGPLFAVYGQDKDSVNLYGLSDGGLEDKGEYPACRIAEITDWYKEALSWGPTGDSSGFPLPPLGMEKVARLADLNNDEILDLVYFDCGEIRFSLSHDGQELAQEKSVPCPSKPSAIRVADVNADGFADILALMGGTGNLEVYLVVPE